MRRLVKIHCEYAMLVLGAPPQTVHTQPPSGGGRLQSQPMEVGAVYRFVPCGLDFCGYIGIGVFGPVRVRVSRKLVHLLVDYLCLRVDTHIHAHTRTHTHTCTHTHTHTCTYTHRHMHIRMHTHTLSLSLGVYNIVQYNKIQTMGAHLEYLPEQS